MLLYEIVRRLYNIDSKYLEWIYEGNGFVLVKVVLIFYVFSRKVY